MRKAETILATILMVSMATNVALFREVMNPPDVSVETATEYVAIRDTTPVCSHSVNTGNMLTLSVQPKMPKNSLPDVLSDKPEPDTSPAVVIVDDSAIVTLPVEQKVYEDSAYTAYVSGYDPRLDSIVIRQAHTYTTMTKVVDKPSRRWSIGPTVGAGYGIVGKQCDVFLGLSVTWNILP